MKEVEKVCTRKEIESRGEHLPGFDHFKSGTLAELKKVNYKVVEIMVHKMELTYDRIIDIFDIKEIAVSAEGNTRPPVITCS